MKCSKRCPFFRYILPSLSRIPNDDEEWIRIAYAAAIGPLSSAAYGFLSSQTSGASSEALVGSSNITPLFYQFLVAKQANGFVKKPCWA